MVELLAALAAGYLLGSLPMAAWVARTHGKDVFRLGSGNMGAMNLARNLGALPGVLVLLLDVGKGALATYVGLLMAGFTATATGGEPTLGAPLAAGLGAVLGHAFSLFARFRGGKALATTLGVSLPLYPQAGLAALVMITALYLVTRRAGLAAVITVLAYPVVTLLSLDRAGWEREPTFQVVTGVLPLTAVVLVKHFMAWRHERQVTASALDLPERPQ